MFTKLLKHEFRATRSMIGMLCLTAIGLGAVGGGAGWYESSHECTQMMSGLLGVVCAVCAMSIVLCAAGAMIVLMVQFYRRHFTDQAYLTFTLPVTTHQQLLAGGVNMVLNILLIILSTAVACGLLGLIPMSTLPGFWDAFGQEFSLVWKEVTARMTPEIFGTMVLTFFAVVGYCMTQLVLVMTSMTVGAFIAKKHKVVAAIAIFYLSQIILPVVAFRILIEAVTFTQVLWICNIGAAVVILMGYFLMYFITSRKLNLP